MQPEQAIQIVRAADGNISVQWRGSDKTTCFGMLEVAKDLLRAEFDKKASAVPGLQIPSADLVPILNGRRMG